MPTRKPRRKVFAKDKLASLVFDDGEQWRYFRVECDLDFNWPFDEKAEHAIIDPETDEWIGIRSYGTHLNAASDPNVPILFRVYLLRPLLVDVETADQRLTRLQEQEAADAEMGIPLTLQAAKELLGLYVFDKTESRREVRKRLELGEVGNDELREQLSIMAKGVGCILKFVDNNDVGAAVEYLEAELKLDSNDQKARNLLRILGALTS